MSRFKLFRLVICAALCLLGIGNASATLIDRGGGLIYDDVLNITWLQDANYAQTSGFDSDGKMLWAVANAWAAGLSYFDSVRSVTWTDWRLAAINLTSPTSGVYSCSIAGGATACAASGNELGYMYYFDLDGAGDNMGDQISVLGGVTLNNIQQYYFSGTEYDSTNAWYSRFDASAYQGFDGSSELSAWAVRPGDVAAAPEPATLALLGFGLAGLGFSKRKRAS